MSRAPLLQKLQKTTGESISIATTLNQRLKELDNEINADEEGVLDLERDLAAQLKERKSIEQELRRSEAFFKSLADGARLGGLMKEFDAMQGFLKEEYAHAKSGHKKAMDLLKKEFNYNPAYKRGRNDKEFSGTYFTPKQNPNKLI